MASQEALASYIKKLDHPMKEIRERSLQLLLAKVRLGWELHDELNGTRKLLEALLAWFQLHQPTLQREALELLLTTIKTKSGSYIAKEFGVKKIIENLNKVKHRIQENALHIFQDVMDTLRFLNTVESEENFNIPRLVLSENSSEAIESNSGYYDLGSDRDSSRKTSISNEGVASNKGSNTFNGISVLLFPWVELSTSDLKTLTLVEDSLRLLKSTRRCCRFIRDVFLRDFRVEIFLNRPAILKTLLSIADRQHGGHPGEALQVLYSITYLLRIRLLQLFSVDLISNSSKTSDEQEAFENSVDVELEQLRSGDIGCTPLEDTLAALRQLPAPIFALDTAYAILSTMARSIVLLEPDVKKEELDMKELDLCLNLVECLIKLLLDCVNDNFWCADHSTKTERDIAHKSCMVMRTIGDLLEKYRNSFNGDIERTHHRVAWLRLVSCAEMMLRWAKNSALPPSALVAALQVAQLDQALDLLYPELSKRVASALLTAKSSVDQEYKSKYRELTNLFAGMEYAVQFMKRKDSSQLTKNILSSIKKSLPVLQLHQSEAYLKEIADILLYKSKFLNFDERDWSEARNIALNLMAHSSERVRVNFYAMIFDMVKLVLVGDDDDQNELEKCLTLICDVGILTEICCHGLSSNNKEIESSASQILLYLLRGRLVLSESCWWRLLASLMPVFPLLHVYAAHDTLLGKAVCKSLEADIVECMGVATSEMVAGLVRLLFVNCAAVQLDAAHALCRLIDDDRYLPPRESIRTSLLMNLIRKLEPQEFNIDINSSPSRTTQTTGLTQILEVLKQDIVLDDDQPQFTSYERSSIHPALEPSLRRSTLQQLAVMMRQQDLHTTFVQNDGLNLIVTILRMSLTVNDYLAFPECAVSCVSVLNSVCFTCRHSLAKIPDLPLLLIRVILVFPTNESCVLMAAQVLAMIAWSGFVLQELDSARRRIPALPLCVTQRTSLPFNTNSYWNTSPNAEHSSVEWLLSEEFWRSAVRVRWWWTYAGGLKALRTNTFTPLRSMPSLCSPTEHDIVSLRTACVVTSCTRALLALENATSHSQVTEALSLLESYTHLVPLSVVINKEFGSLPWQHSRRFLCSPPASSRDTALLITMLQFIIAYMDNVPNNDGTMSWIKSLFIGKDASIITLLSKERLFPQQTTQDDIELTQLRIHIVKILLRCVILLEHEDDYDSHRMESLLKILLACLENVDLKNFHMLGYLNELIRCIRYVHYSRYCKLSEETLILSLRGMSGALGGCAGGAGRKGQACRLDALLTLLALLRQIQEEAIPVQRWSEVWNTEVVRAVSSCVSCERAELRATALHVMSALAHYTQMLPHLLQAISRESLSRHALDIFSQPREANAVRAAAATLLAVLTSRTSPHTQVLEREIRQELKETNYVEHCLHIFVEFFNMKDVVNNYLEPNVPPSLLERESELKVRAQKSEALNVSPNPSPFDNPPPTPALVAAAADVLHNVSGYKNCPVQEWNEQGLFRILFRCASWSLGTPYEFNTVRTASCRALTAYCAHKCVRTALATTKDCLYNLLITVIPLEEDECDSAGISARAQAILLLSALLPEREAADCVWFELMKTHSELFFHLLLQCLDSEVSELQEASLHCLTQLFQSTAHRKHADKSKDMSCIQFLDNLKSPLDQQLNDRYCAGDSVRNDCQPEYMVEDVCKVLMRLYHNLSENQKHLSSQDDRWILVCSCLCSVLSVSGRARLYAVHRQFPTTLQATMQAVRDRLSLQGKPADVIRNANHDPALQTLYWLLTVINCAMLECMSAKEFFAENNMAASLVKLWPWCMMNEPLRCALMNLLLTFTNNCARAWASMCTCVGGRSLMGEVCQLLAREASRPRPSVLLRLSLRVLKQCAPHHHCRSIVLKSDALQCACRVRGGTAAELAAAQFCGAVSKHADGAAALLNVRPRPAQPRMLPALANAAQHARLAFLQAPDLLEVLVGALVTGGTDEAVHAARAAWALAANNHRAKLVMRSAGITTAVQSCMQRLSRLPDQASQRALELLTYTHTVLQAT